MSSGKGSTTICIIMESFKKLQPFTSSTQFSIPNPNWVREKINLVTSKEGGKRLLQSCALISNKVTPKKGRKHHHQHQGHIWIDQRQNQVSIKQVKDVKTAVLTGEPRVIYLFLREDQVTHRFSSSLQPFLFVSTKLHAREKVTHYGQDQTLLNTGNRVIINKT